MLCTFIVHCREIKTYEAETDEVDWGRLKATMKSTKLTDEEGMSIKLKPIPQTEQAVVAEALTVHMETPVSTAAQFFYLS